VTESALHEANPSIADEVAALLALIARLATEPDHPDKVWRSALSHLRLAQIGLTHPPYRHLVGPNLAATVGSGSAWIETHRLHLRATAGLRDGAADAAARVRQFCAWAESTHPPKEEISLHLGTELDPADLLPLLINLLEESLNGRSPGPVLPALVAAATRLAARCGGPDKRVMEWVGWTALGSCLWRAGALDEAEKLYDQLVPRLSAPAHRRKAQLGRAIVAAMRGAFAVARGYFDAVSADNPADEMAELARLNTLWTYIHAEDGPGLTRFVRVWAGAPTCREALPHAASAAGAPRATERPGLALGILVRFAELDWTDDPAGQIRLLEALIELLRELSADDTVAEVCMQLIRLDDRLAAGTTRYLWQDDYDRVGRAYRLLVELYSRVERVDETANWSALSFLEAEKEARFSRAAPTFARSALPPERWAEQARLVGELAALEAQTENRLRGAFGADAIARAARRDLATGPAPDEPTDAELAQRTIEIRDRLARWRADVATTVASAAAFLDATPDALRRALERATVPTGTALLAYRLARTDGRLTAYLLDPTGNLAPLGWDVNLASINALLAVLAQFPENEIDYITDRLSTHMLPPALVDRLDRIDSRAVVLSPDIGLDGVPWEALGRAEWRLGTRFALTRSPSLLRTLRRAGEGAGAELPTGPPVVVANPTGDLPGATAEAATIGKVLAGTGAEAISLRHCTGSRMLELLETSAWLHFAGHTNYFRADPPSSHLLLSDRPVTITELAGTSVLSGSVVVLSSCESSRTGQVNELMSPLGLGAVLLLRGSAVVVASNWPVADDSAGAFMTGLYTRALSRDRSIAEAARAARHELRAAGRPVAEWGQFAVLGDPFARCPLQRIVPS
jgi:hypothetical protein